MLCNISGDKFISQVKVGGHGCPLGQATDGMFRRARSFAAFYLLQ